MKRIVELPISIAEKISLKLLFDQYFLLCGSHFLGEMSFESDWQIFASSDPPTAHALPRAMQRKWDDLVEENGKGCASTSMLRLHHAVDNHTRCHRAVLEYHERDMVESMTYTVFWECATDAADANQVTSFHDTDWVEWVQS
eukprot:PhM_4_TR7758/c0_g1_i1/m.34580